MENSDTADSSSLYPPLTADDADSDAASDETANETANEIANEAANETANETADAGQRDATQKYASSFLYIYLVNVKL
jgi:hypothetical protein